MKHFLILLVTVCISLTSFAQSTPKIKDLENKRGELQKQIAQSETLLRSTKKDVGSQLSSLALLTNQIAERRKYINAIEADVEGLRMRLLLFNGNSESWRKTYKTARRNTNRPYNTCTRTSQ